MLMPVPLARLMAAMTASMDVVMMTMMTEMVMLTMIAVSMTSSAEQTEACKI